MEDPTVYLIYEKYHKIVEFGTKYVLRITIFAMFCLVIISITLTIWNYNNSVDTKDAYVLIFPATYENNNLLFLINFVYLLEWGKKQ